MNHVHVFAPLPIDKFVHAGKCPDCKKWSRFIGAYYEWYGATKTCLKCGRRFNDGEWEELNFRRGVRQENIKRAKQHWRTITVRRLSDDR